MAVTSRLEISARLNGLGRLCEHLQPLWRTLQWRSAESDFGLRQNLALVEAMAHLASRAERDERLIVEIQVGPTDLRSRLRRAPAPDATGVSASGLLRPLVDGMFAREA